MTKSIKLFRISFAIMVALALLMPVQTVVAGNIQKVIESIYERLNEKEVFYGSAPNRDRGPFFRIIERLRNLFREILDRLRDLFGRNRGFIQNAIDRARRGDTIKIPAGTYCENIVIDKPITLIGEGANCTIIDGRHYGDVVTITSYGVTIQGFAIKRGEDGIDSDNYYLNITDNIIQDNTGSGIRLTESAHNVISRNIIQNNSYEGIDASRSCSTTKVSENIIENNGGAGIDFYDSHSLVISDNIIRGNSGTGITLFDSIKDIISGNTITNNDMGIRFMDVKDSEISHNVIEDNEDVGVVLQSESKNCIVSNNTIARNRDGRGMGVWNVSYCTISDNMITEHDGTGIQLSASHCIIQRNIISKNERGIVTSKGASNNKIIENTIIANSFRGIDITWGTSDCWIYLNNFINNGQNAYDTTSDTENSYDNDYSKGNYWDDYNGVDANSDGIGDTPYEIPPTGRGVDRYPLMEPWNLDPDMFP